jgi:hypothetical protein
VPVVLVVGLGFRGGGFSPDATAVAALAALALLALRVVLTPAAFARPSKAAMLAVGAMAALAAWTLASSLWSDAASRAMLEHQRTLLYAALLALFVSIGRSGARARALTAALAVGVGVVGVASLGPWLLPETFPVAASVLRGRLNWPTGYWNATGLVAAIGIVLAVHLCCSLRDHPLLRCLGAAAVAPLVAALVFSESRGALAAAALATLLWLVAGRSRGVLTGGSVAVVAAALGAVLALGVEGLGEVRPSAVALDDGRRVALLLGVVAILAALTRVALVLAADRRVARMRFPSPGPWVARAAVALVVVLVAAGLAGGGAGRLGDAWTEFTDPAVVEGSDDAGQRLTRLGNNGRIEVWDVAWDAGLAEPLHGSGAGTYALLWDRDRASDREFVDAHSLYVETFGELGVVGAVLLLTALLTMLGALWWRALREADGARPAWAALAAVASAWAVHAGVDWDWEMPALTAWLFCAGGFALARDVEVALMRSRPGRMARIAGVLGAAGCVALALVPLAVLRSQGPLLGAQRALRAGNCASVIDHARAAGRAMDARPEPLELLAVCDIRAGRDDLAARAAGGAVRRDPGNWELRYTQALVDAATGRDPRGAAREALDRNPRDPHAQDAARRFVAANRDDWRTLALSAWVPLGGTLRAELHR